MSRSSCHFLVPMSNQPPTAAVATCTVSSPLFSNVPIRTPVVPCAATESCWNDWANAEAAAREKSVNRTTRIVTDIHTSISKCEIGGSVGSGCPHRPTAATFLVSIQWTRPLGGDSGDEGDGLELPTFLESRWERHTDGVHS